RRVISSFSLIASDSRAKAPTWTHQWPPGSAFGRTGAGNASTFTFATPARYTPVAFAAASERSMMRPWTNGPRSVIFTTADWLLVRFVTRTIVPIGRVRGA